MQEPYEGWSFMRKKTVFLLGFLPNPRMYKRIALAQQYSDAHLVCWDRGKEMQENPRGNGISCDIIQINAGNDPIKRIIPYRRFSKAALKIIKTIKPDIIHVQGIDMLKIACRYKKTVNRNTKIIYEIADLHRLLVDKQSSIVGKFAQKYLRYTDRKCSKDADLLIVTSQKYYDSYFQTFVPKEKAFYFPNVPDLSAFEKFKKKSEREPFTVGYFGVIRYKNELKLLLQAIREEHTGLIIAGYEENDHEIEMLCKDNPDVTWVGRYDFKKSAAELYGQCDCVYAVYDADMANCRVALPNKLYEAVYCELPIIVAANTHVGEIVSDWGVGISVTHDSQKEVSDALHTLKDPGSYQKFADNCIRHKQDIDLEYYNTKLIEKIRSL